jgi:superfamily II DNA/RNA helicase
VQDDQKRDALLALIKSQEVKNAIVFCNRKRDVATLHTTLKKHGINAGALHGDMSQPARTETLEKFKAGDIQILVASDVAARGLDVQDMSHVFNYDVPFSPEDYVHRIGRTGRAGKTGHSFTLATPSEGDLIDAIQKLINTTIPRVEVPGLDIATLEAGDGRRRGRGGRRVGRGGAVPDRGRGPRREPREHREPRAEAPAEKVHAEAPPAAEPRHEPRPDRPPRERRPEHRSESRSEPRSERRPERHHDRDDGHSPKGLGDHVPAFLARR